MLIRRTSPSTRIIGGSPAERCRSDALFFTENARSSAISTCLPLVSRNVPATRRAHGHPCAAAGRSEYSAECRSRQTPAVHATRSGVASRPCRRLPQFDLVAVRVDDPSELAEIGRFGIGQDVAAFRTQEIGRAHV